LFLIAKKKRMNPILRSTCFLLLVVAAISTTSCRAEATAPFTQPKATPTLPLKPPAASSIAAGAADHGDQHESSSHLKRQEEHAEIGEFFSETGFYQSLRLSDDKPLLRKQSPYQLIEVYETPYYGKVLVLDGVLQLTERDADAYNEMMAHVPMMQHESGSGDGDGENSNGNGDAAPTTPMRVLVIGGGDGYVVNEVLKHEAVVHVDHVDLDGDVVQVCKQQFAWGKVWDDERVHLHVADGAAFCANALDATYDVIIQDSSDPWGVDENGNQIDLPSGALYSKQHFAHLHRILKPNGILNFQAETIAIPADLKGMMEWRKIVLDVGFASARYGSIIISSYPTGQLGFLMCEKKIATHNVEKSIAAKTRRMRQAGLKTSYYHPALQSASFVLPLWVHRTVYGDEDEEADDDEDEQNTRNKVLGSDDDSRELKNSQ
jgi:spermidine synthase